MNRYGDFELNSRSRLVSPEEEGVLDVRWSNEG